MPSAPHFTPEFFTFLRRLGKNNNREWFQANKGVYEEHVKAPMLRFIGDLRGPMAKVSPHIDVDPKAVGGSMHRLNRDTRFSKDKSLYKTSVTATFTHARGGDLMLGYHVGLEPGKVHAYFGIWEPEGPVLEKIRARILSHGEEWQKAAGGKFRATHTFEGESLKRPPTVNGKPVDPGHPFIDDLKRKSHAASTVFDEKAACSAGFLDEYVVAARAGAPLMVFLCKAVGLPF